MLPNLSTLKWVCHVCKNTTINAQTASKFALSILIDPLPLHTSVFLTASKEPAYTLTLTPPEGTLSSLTFCSAHAEQAAWPPWRVCMQLDWRIIPLHHLGVFCRLTNQHSISPAIAANNVLSFTVSLRPFVPVSRMLPTDPFQV